MTPTGSVMTSLSLSVLTSVDGDRSPVSTDISTSGMTILTAGRLAAVYVMISASECRGAARARREWTEAIWWYTQLLRLSARRGAAVDGSVGTLERRDVNAEACTAEKIKK